MVVSRSGFTTAAVRLATEQGAGKIDLLSPRDLRNWLEKHAPEAAPDKTADFIIRHAMKAIARLIAQNPEQLVAVEWRDLERILREVFEGLGFDTRLTRPAKDGGFDLELVTSTSGQKRTYLVEVKHWTEKQPGLPHLQRFVHVTTSAKATTGLLLSTSGFTRTLYEGFAKITAPVRLGDGEKVVSLCKAYYRLESALWLEARDCEEMLLGGTLQAAADPWGVRRET
jgi:restriction endonuclease Mrr